MKKTNFLIILFFVILSSCSMEDKTTDINTYGLVDFSKKDNNVTKQQIVHSYETDV